MNYIHIDFETRSPVDLKKAGVDVYSRHPDTDVWCAAWAFEDDEPEVGPIVEAPGEHDFTELLRPLELDDVTYVAHNAPFELAIWNNIMAPRYGWPELPPERIECTMAEAYAMSLPGALDDVAVVLGVDQRKDDQGRRIMLQLAQPRKPRKGEDPDGLYWWDDEEKIQRLYEYCKQDVRTERAVHKRLFRLPPRERTVWLWDHAINNRGIAIDKDAAKAVQGIAERAKAELNQRMREATGGAVGACTNTGQIKDWLGWQGVKTKSADKAAVETILDMPDLSPNVEEVLKLRQAAGKTSVSKVNAMLNGVSDDGRVRGMFQYHAAGTGRWGGRRIQLHNLPRPKISAGTVADILNDAIYQSDPGAYIELFYGDTMPTLSDCLRGMLIAGPGKDLIAADFANIEGRGLAWLAGEEWKLKAFRDFDAGIGPDLYLVAVSNLYGYDILECKPHRQEGKVIELGMGFGGGVGAAQTMAKTYGVDLAAAAPLVWERAPERFKEQVIESWEENKKRLDMPKAVYVCGELIKLAFRAQNPKIVDFWYDLENAALRATNDPGAQVTAGHRQRPVHYRRVGQNLWCKLPSGRVLCYPYAEVRDVRTPWGQMKPAVTYMTVDGVSRKWIRTNTYGGKLAENVTQAICRDLLAEAIVRLEQATYPVVLHVHDEAVCEIDEDECDTALLDMTNIMTDSAPWAEGLPVVAEGWRGKRYRK